MKVLKYIAYILIIYIYLHNPIVRVSGDLGSIKFLYVLALGTILFNVRALRHFQGYFKAEHSFIILLILFSILRYLGGGEIDYVRVYLVSYVELFLLPFTLLMIGEKLFNGVGYDKLVSSLLIVASLGAVISCACIAYPPFNNYIRSSIFGVLEGDALYEATFRGFGISEGLTYSYGIVQSILLILGIDALRDNKWFAPFAVFVFISCAINARTSLLIAGVGLIIYCIVNRSYKSFIVTLLIVAFFSYAFIPILYKIGVDDQTMVWLGKFTDELTAVVNSRSLSSSDTGAALFGDMFFFPDNIGEWILGKGVNVYYTKPHNSDVGWIIQINYGGLVYVGILYSYVIYMFRRLKTVRMPVISLFFVAVFLIANTKGPLIPNSGGWRLMILLYYCILWQYGRVSNTIKN